MCANVWTYTIRMDDIWPHYVSAKHVVLSHLKTHSRSILCGETPEYCGSKPLHSSGEYIKLLSEIAKFAIRPKNDAADAGDAATKASGNRRIGLNKAFTRQRVIHTFCVWSRFAHMRWKVCENRIYVWLSPFSTIYLQWIRKGIQLYVLQCRAQHTRPVKGFPFFIKESNSNWISPVDRQTY